MNQIIPHETDPAAAFEAMRQEISLLHQAIRGLAAARENIPDYSETLGQANDALHAIHGRLKVIEGRPALTLTPVAMADQINSAAQTVRAEDRQTLTQMHGQLAQTVGRVSELVGRKRATVEQERQLMRIGLGGLLAGILLWSILPGAIARSLPVSWHVPEWMASRTMGMEQKEAGRRMILTAPKENGR